MLPLAAVEVERLARLRGVFADIDDTLTTQGCLTAEAYSLLERLHAAGLIVVPITGRPAGWCDHIARMWPVDAVVGENGAFYFSYDRGARRLVKRYLASDAERAADRERLRAIGEKVLAAVPGAGLASDQLYRESDLAIDYCEDVAPLSRSAVEQIVALLSAEGLTAKVSSIHVNGWFGRYDKLSMTRIMLAECFAVDLDTERERFAFVGDSPNDAPMFAYFPLSIGVANVCAFLDRMAAAPAFVTTQASGAGFAEFATRVLAARGVRQGG